MRRTFRTLGLTVSLCGLAVGQPAPKTPGFEAADVHVSAAGGNQSGGFLPNGRLEFRSTTLLRLISVAYSVPVDRVAGGPNWIDADRFDVVAKAAGSASAAALRVMLQNLLAERFNLSIQREEKPLPVYALTLGKRGAPKESSAPGDPDCKLGAEENVRTLACHNVTMESLAEQLPGVARGYFDRPVVDRTGLKGAYDFKLEWLPRGQVAAGGEGSLYLSIEKQLGVKVDPQTSPMPVLTVEKVDRKPADNPPGVTEKLGPAPTEFEVADVRRSRPDEKQDFLMNGGRLDARAVSLKELIAFAYDVEEDWLRGGEKWLDADHYNILAKTAPTASIDTLRTMTQSLLAERFKLKVHKEPQPVTVYALTAGKHKLKDADPSARPGCKLGLADGARTYTCQNTTMADFAEKLRNVAAAYLEHPVVDLTGLKGAYDFALTWSPKGRILGSGPGAAPAATDTAGAPTAVDRPVGFTIFEAVERNLGLKLAAQKHPMPVIVIDHVERTPTEN